MRTRESSRTWRPPLTSFSGESINAAMHFRIGTRRVILVGAALALTSSAALGQSATTSSAALRQSDPTECEPWLSGNGGSAGYKWHDDSKLCSGYVVQPKASNSLRVVGFSRRGGADCTIGEEGLLLKRNLSTPINLVLLYRPNPDADTLAVTSRGFKNEILIDSQLARKKPKLSQLAVLVKNESDTRALPILLWCSNPPPDKKDQPYFFSLQSRSMLTSVTFQLQKLDGNNWTKIRDLRTGEPKTLVNLSTWELDSTEFEGLVSSVDYRIHVNAKHG